MTELICKTCNGFGLYPIGSPTPIGRMDAAEWKGYVKKCPSCGQGDLYWEGCPDPTQKDEGKND